MKASFAANYSLAGIGRFRFVMTATHTIVTLREEMRQISACISKGNVPMPSNWLM
jgi:hypothetical protein